MPFTGHSVHLTAAQRSDLEEFADSPSLPAGFVRRAKMMLLLGDGHAYRTVATKLDVSAPTIAKWKQRSVTDGIDGVGDGLYDAPPSSPW